MLNSVMRNSLLRKGRRATVVTLCGVAALAIVVIAGGATYAATAAAPRTITACVHHSGGGLYEAAKCAAHDSSLTWNVTGPAGAPGLSLFVRADQNGKVYEHSAGVTVSKVTTTEGPYYVVTFPQNISGCAAVVSQGETSNNGFIPGTFYEAVVQSDADNSGNPHQVYVYPSNTAGDAVSAGFDLILAC